MIKQSATGDFMKKYIEIIRGIAITLVVTLIARVVTVVAAELADPDDVFGRALYIVIFVLDSAIFACGAATVISQFGSVRRASAAAGLVVALTAVDYATSLLMDIILGNASSSGLEIVAALYLILNLLARAMMYALLVAFLRLFAKSMPDTPPIPLFSHRHALSVGIIAAAVLRVAPSIINELTANIRGLIEYGFDMTAGDAVAILSSYGEIIVDGAIVYFTAYLALLLIKRRRK